ncbi:MAG TPA: hypothetical protein P5572_10070 [Phycisphaerae bacterium]|nr:hypothetical protein [Phycisphaerae bacterium]
MLADGCFIWIIIAVVVGVAMSWGGSTAPGACPRCNTPNRRVARYCRRCGMRLR